MIYNNVRTRLISSKYENQKSFFLKIIKAKNTKYKNVNVNNYFG